MADDLSPEGKAFVHEIMLRAQDMTRLGLTTEQIWDLSTPGRDGFLLRLGAMLSAPQCACGRGLEHLAEDHAEMEREGYLN